MAKNEKPIDVNKFFKEELDFAKDGKGILTPIEKSKGRDLRRKQKISKITKMAESEKIEAGDDDVESEIEKLGGKILDIHIQIQEGNRSKKLNAELKDLNAKLSLLKAEKRKIDNNENLNNVDEKTNKKTVTEATSEEDLDKSKESEIKNLEETKAALNEELKSLDVKFDDSLKRNFGRNINNFGGVVDIEKNTQKADINQISEKNMVTKKIENNNLEEAYRNQLVGEDKEESNLYEEVNKKSALEEEQERTKKAYVSDFENREKNLKAEENDWRKLREKEDIEKEKRAAELKEQEEFTASYKRQFGGEDEDVKTSDKIVNAEKTSTADTDTDNTDNSKIQKIVEEKNKEFNKLPEEMKEILRGTAMDQKVKGIEIEARLEDKDRTIEMQKEEIARLKETVERVNRIEVMLAKMQTDLDRQVEKEKNPILKKAINYFKKPKVHSAIATGLVGAGIYAASGGAAVPVFLVAKAALKKSGFSGYLAEKLGLSKGEKDGKEKPREGMEKIKNIDIDKDRQGGENLSENKNWLDNKGEIDIGAVVKSAKEYDEEFIDRLENDPDFFDKTINAFKKKSKLISLSGKQEDINKVFKWLKDSQKELIENEKAIAAGNEINEPKKSEETSELVSSTGKNKTESFFVTDASPDIEQLSSVESAGSEETETKIEKEKKSEARKKIYEMAALINKNGQTINIGFLLAIHEEVEKEFENNNYETIAPMVELVKYLIENKEKFAFLDKTKKSSILNAEEKDALIREIQIIVIGMTQEGRLGATSEEKEKNMKNITKLLDNREFKSRI